VPSLMHRRRALKQLITYIGLDVHKETIAVALAEAGKRNEVREYGKIANTPAAVKALVAKLARNGHELHFCYEAGPCGYGIQRQLTASKHDCIVVAPSLIPRRPGERIKTDRRDAINLAKLHRAGELTPVWVPDEAHEAIRDLVRARLAAVRTVRHARQQLSSFLLRHGHHYNRPALTLMHRRWLAGLRFEHAVHHIVLEDLHCSGRGGDGTARPSGSPHRRGAAGLVARHGGARAAGAARHGAGGSGNAGCRTR
jgi:transposase